MPRLRNQDGIEKGISRLQLKLPTSISISSSNIFPSTLQTCVQLYWILSRSGPLAQPPSTSVGPPSRPSPSPSSLLPPSSLSLPPARSLARPPDGRVRVSLRDCGEPGRDAMNPRSIDRSIDRIESIQHGVCVSFRRSSRPRGRAAKDRPGGEGASNNSRRDVQSFAGGLLRDDLLEEVPWLSYDLATLSDPRFRSRGTRTAFLPARASAFVRERNASSRASSIERATSEISKLRTKVEASS